MSMTYIFSSSNEKLVLPKEALFSRISLQIWPDPCLVAHQLQQVLNISEVLGLTFHLRVKDFLTTSYFMDNLMMIPQSYFPKEMKH